MIHCCRDLHLLPVLSIAYGTEQHFVSELDELLQSKTAEGEDAKTAAAKARAKPQQQKRDMSAQHAGLGKQEDKALSDKSQIWDKELEAVKGQLSTALASATRAEAV